jgi:thiamine pyrophosphokinase
MRAVVFIGGDGPAPGSIPGGLGSYDLSVAADSGLLLAEAWGFAPDWIVGDMDSIGDPDLLSAYPEHRIRVYARDKDDTDTEIAISLAAEQGCSEWTLVGGGGGRLDHLMAIIALFERPAAPVRWITRFEDAALVDAERGGGRYSALARPGSLFSIFPLGSGPWGIGSEGLKWPLGGLSWDRGRFGISNVCLGDRFVLRARSGRFLALSPLSGKSAPGEGFGQP